VDPGSMCAWGAGAGARLTVCCAHSSWPERRMARANHAPPPLLLTLSRMESFDG